MYKKKIMRIENIHEKDCLFFFFVSFCFLIYRGIKGELALSLFTHLISCSFLKKKKKTFMYSFSSYNRCRSVICYTDRFLCRWPFCRPEEKGSRASSSSSFLPFHVIILLYYIHRKLLIIQLLRRQ